jgi:hypothetical protein
MPSHIETVLTTLGVPAEDAAKIIATPEAEQASFDAKPFADKVKENYKKQFENDPEFFSAITLEKLPPDIKKRLESSQYGRAANITRDKLLKGLGMTESDYADLTDDEKEKLELFVPAIAQRYAKTKSNDKQLQADLIEARKKLEGFDGYEEKIKGKYETESNEKVTAAIFNAALISELSSIDGLKISASDIAKTANDILQNKYSFERVGDFSVELRQKANPQMKVLKDGSSHELTLKEALKEIAEERGWVEKEQKKQQGSGTMKVEPKNGTLSMIPPHLQDKISKKIAAEQ